MGIKIDGKRISDEIRREIKAEVEKCALQKKTPGLAVILVGDNPASQIYVRNKIKACAETGIYSENHSLPADTPEEKIMELIGRLNKDPKIHGILVQLPLPETIRTDRVINAIDPQKDVDGFHPVNIGKMFLGTGGFLPCTPAGIIQLLDRSGVSVDGKKCVVVGRSNIVGKPIAAMLLQKNGTVTVCHSRTKNLGEVTRTADILIVAVGKAGIINESMIKPGTVIIDVGINRDENGNLCGDVDYDNCFEKAGMITPVPGGVGPMTITMLLKNTVTAAISQGDVLWNL